jgi:hypothetical protein
MGFESLGYVFVVILAVIVRPIVGLAFLLPAWIRVAKSNDSAANHTMYWLLAAILAEPLYLAAFAELSSLISSTSNAGLLGVLPAPVITFGCSMVGLVQSFQSESRAAKVVSIVLMIYFVLETILLAFFVLPHLT